MAEDFRIQTCIIEPRRPFGWILSRAKRDSVARSAPKGRGTWPRPLTALAFLLLFLFAGLTHAAAAPAAAASVEQPVMALGQSNTYTISIRNAAAAPRLAPPDVAGLVFSRNASTHNSMQYINGVASREIRFSWTFQAERPGRFVIPGREIEVDNKRIQISDTIVEVGEMPREMRDRFFLRWKVPQGPFYVGQAIPATLQLYVRAGINAGLGSHPHGSSEQFIGAEFKGDPRQRQESVNGQTFSVVEWDTVVTPIRPGRGVFPISLVLVYETDRVQRDFFGTRRAQEQIRLTTGDNDWEVRDLPRTNRPGSFSGAVGTFEVGATLSKRKLEVGDPLTFSLEVKGEGNFERIEAPEFQETGGWRVYPPRAQMTEEGVSYRGVKKFEYILTPTSETVKEVPPVAFSWFDPESGGWQETEVAPQPVEIQPASSSPGRGHLAEIPESGSSPESESVGTDSMASSPGPHRTLRPAWRQPGFWIVNGGLSCLMAFGLIGAMRQRQAAQTPYLQVRSAAARKAKEIALQAVEAARRQDALAFYTGAREALRHFLATLSAQSPNPDSLTWEDLEAILRSSSFDEDSLARMRNLFERKDAVQFAGWKPSADELDNDRETFEALLNQIVTQKR